jgi:hypothetical protein
LQALSHHSASKDMCRRGAPAYFNCQILWDITLLIKARYRLPWRKQPLHPKIGFQHSLKKTFRNPHMRYQEISWQRPPL